MRKFHIALILIGVAILAAAIWLFLSLRHDPAPALLRYERGEVLVDGQAVSADMALREGAVVSTREGEATVVLHESVFVMLKPHSEATVIDLDEKSPRMRYGAGNMTVNLVHATTVAEFDLEHGDATIHINGTLLTVDQVRMIAATGNVIIKTPLAVISVTNERITLINDRLQAISYPLSAGDRQQLIYDALRAIGQIRRERQALIDEYPELVSLASKRSGMSREELFGLLESYDTKDQEDIDAALARAPVVTPLMEQVAAYTAEIQLLYGFIGLQDSMIAQSPS